MATTTGSVLIQKDVQVEVVSDAGSIVDGSYNTGTVTALTPVNELTYGDAVLSIQFSSAPAAGASFYLFRQDLAIDGANDAESPSTTYEHTYMGAFPINTNTTRQFVPLAGIPLTTSQKFAIKNDAGQPTTGTTTVKITPKTPNTQV